MCGVINKKRMKDGVFPICLFGDPTAEAAKIVFRRHEVNGQNCVMGGGNHE